MCAESLGRSTGRRDRVFNAARTLCASHMTTVCPGFDAGANCRGPPRLHASCTVVAARTLRAAIVAGMKPSLTAALIVIGLSSLATPSLQELHESGIAHHLERSLDAASGVYDEVLRRDPPREPTPAEWRAIERFAPRIFVTASEPFQLRDAAAIMHPDTGLIAYHLFWDDDIDFPDDNDPSDHEVVWSTVSRDQATLTGFRTYFHGRVLAADDEALRDAAAHGGRPAAFVQWGKHGSMPQGWQRLSIVAEDGETESAYYPLDRPITLLEYNRGTWRKLTAEGRRVPGNPIAARAGWPLKFAGDWPAFSTFPVGIDPVPMMRERRAALVSRWNAATLNRWLVRYNFRPKLEWPDETTPAPEPTPQAATNRFAARRR